MDARRGAPAQAQEGAGRPVPTLRTWDAVALVLGIVVGVGIFRTPSAVAANAATAPLLLLAWGAGGIVSLAGALCYAELAAAYPSAGGDYHFLTRGLGRSTAFLFGWARLTVIPTGSVALLGFVFEDYASELLGGRGAGGALAAALVIGLTLVNVSGLRVARRTQNVLTAALVGGLVLVIATGLLVEPAPALATGPAAAAATADGGGAFGLAMVFVLLAYGGWNEAAYVSSEMRGGPRAMVRALVVSLAAVMALYLLANAAYLRGLGLAGLKESDAVAADLLSRGLGPAGATAIAVLVALSAITSANATLLMGSRMVWAFGRDFPMFAPLGRWSGRAGTPVNAILIQGAIALALVGFGAASRSGFEAMVAYTAPVFWLFFLLTGVTLLVLRVRDPAAPRPFRVPLYPLTPLLFCGACLFLLWSSLRYAGPGALAGVAVLATGLVPLLLSRRRPLVRDPATT